MTLLRWLAFLFVLLAPCAADAIKICGDHKPENCAQPLVKGQPAPFTGQLNTRSLQIDLDLKAESCATLIEREVEFERKKLELDLKLEQHLRSEEQTAFERALAAALADRDRWKRAAEIPFYERPWFVALLTTGVIGGTVAAILRLSKEDR